MTGVSDPFGVIGAQLVLGCSAIHAQHGFQTDAAHDCHAPEADQALSTLRSRLEAETERADKAEEERDASIEFANDQAIRAEAAEERADKAERDAEAINSGVQDLWNRADAAESRITQLTELLELFDGEDVVPEELHHEYSAKGLAAGCRWCVVHAALSPNPQSELPDDILERVYGSVGEVPDQRCPTCGSTDPAHRYLTVRMPHSEKRCPDPWHMENTQDQDEEE